MYNVEKDYRARIFIPKSLLNEKGNAPYWFVRQKIEEAEAQAGMRGGWQGYGGYVQTSSGFNDYVEYLDSDVIKAEYQRKIDNAKNTNSKPRSFMSLSAKERNRILRENEKGLDNKPTIVFVNDGKLYEIIENA